MRSKGRQSKYSLLLLFVGIFAFWWGIAVLSQTSRTTPPITNTPAETKPVYVPQTISGDISLSMTKEQATVYSFNGTLPLTTPCDQLSTGLAVSGSSTVHVTIPLILTKPVTECKQVFDGSNELPFSLSMSVRPGVKVIFDGLTVNGVIVNTISATSTR